MIMTESYLIGNVIRLSATFTDVDGVATSPSTVTLSVKKRGEAASDFTPTSPSTGSFYYDFTPATEGVYYYTFNGTGSLVAATQGQFSIYSEYQ
jgi:hypothetical protein